MSRAKGLSVPVDVGEAENATGVVASSPSDEIDEAVE